MKRKIVTLLIILAGVGVNTAFACGCGCNHNHERSIQSEENTEEKVQCPVMKNWILQSEAADSVEYNGKTYYFCCPGCKPKFVEDPEKYI